jgi:hypothetical protein
LLVLNSNILISFPEHRTHLLHQRGDLCSAWLPLSIRLTN